MDQETFSRSYLGHALSSYGRVFEQWFDRACGEGPNGKQQVYDWTLFNSTVNKMQPDAVIFSDYGPGWFWRESENSRVKSLQHLEKSSLLQSHWSQISERSLQSAVSYMLQRSLRMHKIKSIILNRE